MLVSSYKRDYTFIYGNYFKFNISYKYIYVQYKLVEDLTAIDYDIDDNEIVSASHVVYFIS